MGDQPVWASARRALPRLFHLAEQRDRPVADPSFFETLDKILAAVARATRQVPADHTMWTTPDRDRPFKVFCYHILVDPLHVLDAIASGKYDGGFKLTYGEKSEPFQSRDELRRSANACGARVPQAAEDFTEARLAR